MVATMLRARLIGLASVPGCHVRHRADLGGCSPCCSEPGRLSLSCPKLTDARAHHRGADLSHMLANFCALLALTSPPLAASACSRSERRARPRGGCQEVTAPEHSDAQHRAGGAERGRDLARVFCTECVRPPVRGDPGDSAPKLAVAKASTPEAFFARLTSNGIALAGGERVPGFMSKVARQHFSALRPDEVSAPKSGLNECGS
jgi:hypothetical protein